MATSCMVSGRQPNTCTTTVEVSEAAVVSTLDLCICDTSQALAEMLSNYAVYAVPVQDETQGLVQVAIPRLQVLSRKSQRTLGCCTKLVHRHNTQSAVCVGCNDQTYRSWHQIFALDLDLPGCSNLKKLRTLSVKYDGARISNSVSGRCKTEDRIALPNDSPD